MPEVKLELPPVGVCLLPEGEVAGLGPCAVVSYCEAVRRATAGEELLVRRESITSCRWSPVVLGLKEAESGFEQRQEPRLRGTEAVFLASLAAFEARGMHPDVVIIRDAPQTLNYLAFQVGRKNCVLEYAEEVDKSALGYLRERRPDWRVRLTMFFNHALSLMRKQAWFQRLTATVFRSEAVSAFFDRIISRTMADMSVCRNSTVIPHKSGCANISFFCSGGILWGGNRYDHMTSGWPYPIFEELRKKVKLTW